MLDILLGSAEPLYAKFQPSARHTKLDFLYLYGSAFFVSQDIGLNPYTPFRLIPDVQKCSVPQLDPMGEVPATCEPSRLATNHADVFYTKVVTKNPKGGCNAKQYDGLLVVGAKKTTKTTIHKVWLIH